MCDSSKKPFSLRVTTPEGTVRPCDAYKAQDVTHVPTESLTREMAPTRLVGLNKTLEDSRGNVASASQGHQITPSCAQNNCNCTVVHICAFSLIGIKCNTS